MMKDHDVSGSLNNHKQVTLELRDLYKGFGKVAAVRGINLSPSPASS